MGHGHSKSRRQHIDAVQNYHPQRRNDRLRESVLSEDMAEAPTSLTYSDTGIEVSEPARPVSRPPFRPRDVLNIPGFIDRVLFSEFEAYEALRLDICADRMTRRGVMFAKNLVRKGKGGGGRKRKHRSNVKC